MKYLFQSCIVSILLLPAYFSNAQSFAAIKLNQTGTPETFSHFSIVEVVDGRKDTLNNGFTQINKKKIKIEFENGAAYQIGKYLKTDLSERNNELLPVVIRITKLLLTERQSSKGRMAKTELTIQFLRRDHGDLIQLNETGSWMEQAITAEALNLQEKIIRELFNRMLKQFDKQVEAQKDNPIFASRIEFKVIHSTVENTNGDTIFWDKDFKLTWDDFQGKPGIGEFAAQSNCAFAQAVFPTVENGTGIFYINSRAAFFKGTSWVKKENKNNDILAHEQLHFDIAEWQIRLLRKAIIESDLSFNNYSSIVNTLYNEAWNKYNIVQESYDRETAHGTIAEEQQRWMKKVSDEISGLKEY